MAVSESRSILGVPRVWWDDDTELVHAVEADGVTPRAGWPRPYDTIDLEAKAERAARAGAQANAATQLDRLRQGIPKMRDAIAAVDTLASNTSGNTRALATHLGTSLRANLALAKMVAGVLDTAD